MTRTLLLLIALAAVLFGAGAVQPAEDAPMRFFAVEVRIDPQGQPLAAYQVEVIAKGAKLVGVEGGESDAYATPPQYDPAALHDGGGERVIIAAIGDGNGRPTGESIVAVLHYAIESETDPTPTCVLIAAGDPQANRLNGNCRATLISMPTEEGARP